MRIAQKKKTKPLIIAVVGPTSSGKSDIAVLLAETFGGEVVSADSRQVYRGLDIGTGEITKKEMRGVPHHLLDIASPTRRFTASLYQKKARLAMSQIFSRGNIPIICGGTGFYIDTFLKGLSLPEVPPNRPLRQALEKKSTEELFAMLYALDSRRVKTIDRHNPRRLVRAIEIATTLGQVPPVTHVSAMPAPILTIGIAIPDKKLKKNIHVRLLKRMKLGMISEARRLHNNGLSWKRFEELGLEYRFLARYLQKKMSRQEMLTQLETAIDQYAKRQKQWFKRDPSIVWVKNAKEAVQAVKKFIAC
ncbi:MAG: tRNA (adenosine(37)-N6)-dimethylallyltransferase MiaA [Candidatus Lloydbacteria bacterium]|nr:tRNA (adenosine(37)-N6)-dimethylallyltransferase MiaA [Candidatus Lloydbacteria bacterium]